MRDTTIFEDFLDTDHGRKVWKAFLRTKNGIENPVELIAKKSKPKKKNNYLEVGGGLGEKTIFISRKLGFKNIDFLEPSEKGSSIFAKTAKKNKINFRIINTSFEEFKPDRKYDLITSIHSWYYIDLRELNKLHSILNRGGVACIFLDSRSDVVKKLHDVCDKFMGFRSNSIEDIADFLDKQKIEYDLFCYKKELTGLIRKDGLTPKAKTIMSLIAYRKWNKIPDNAKEEARKMLISYGRDIYPIRRCLITIKK